MPISTYFSGFRGLFLLVAVLGLAACSSVAKNFDRKAQEANPAPCPNVLVLPEASRTMKFNGEREIDNIAWSGEIINVRTSCRYYGDKPIQAEVTVDFAFGKGPMAGGNQTEMTYFVAVTRTNRDLIAKEEFTIPVKFKNNQSVVRVTEKVPNILIPRADENTSGVNFEIVVGLSLSQSEVIYNRSGKSLRFPNL